jgi:hypothetical protein
MLIPFFQEAEAGKAGIVARAIDVKTQNTELGDAQKDFAASVE